MTIGARWTGLLRLIIALCAVALLPAVAHADGTDLVPSVVSAPVIEGLPAVGDWLTASPGTWTNDPTSYDYEWLVCNSSNGCIDIGSSTQSQFEITAAEQGDTLKVQVVASNSAASSLPATSAATAAVAPAPNTITMTLRASINPATPGASVDFTATLSTPVDGGTISFYSNNSAVPGCTGLPLNSSNTEASCTVSDLGVGTLAVSAQYNGDVVYAAASASLVETVQAAAAATSTISKTRQAPPLMQVGKAEPRSEPNFNLTLLALRTPTAPYRYWFALKGVRCFSRASAVLVTIGKRRVEDRCGAQIELASAAVAVHHYYKLTLQAVRYRSKHRIAARGHAYLVKLYVPGSEVQWTPLTGVTLPLIEHSTKLARGSQWRVPGVSRCSPRKFCAMYAAR
jgi:Bacterial Ig-like domain (group 3)